MLIPIDTCRVADTRPAPDTVGPKSSPLGAAASMTVNAQEPGTDCSGKIPTTATALSLNVTALNATSNSFISIWPDGPRPTASALNPAPGQRVFNAVTTELAGDQTFRIYNNRGDVDVFVDINGYYEDHNHDDRYVRLDQVPSGSTGFRAIGTVVTDSGSSSLTGTSAPDDVQIGLVRNSVGDYTLELTGLDEQLTAVVMLTAFGDATDDEARVCSLGQISSTATSYTADIDCFGPDPAIEIDISPADASFQFLVLG